MRQPRRGDRTRGLGICGVVKGRVPLRVVLSPLPGLCDDRSWSPGLRLGLQSNAPPGLPKDAHSTFSSALGEAKPRVELNKKVPRLSAALLTASPS
jgi:hypothetical protein